MATHPLVYPGPHSCLFHGLLHQVFIDMVAPDLVDPFEQRGKPPLHLARNHPVLESLCARFGRCLMPHCPAKRGTMDLLIRGVSWQEHLMEELEGIPHLAELPVGNTLALTRLRQKRLDVPSRSFAQTPRRDEAGKVLRPVHVERGALRPPPVLLHTGPAGSPKRMGFVGIGRNTASIYTISPDFRGLSNKDPPLNRRNYDIIIQFLCLIHVMSEGRHEHSRNDAKGNG